MRIGIPAEFLGTVSCGPATYTHTLLRGLAELETLHTFHPYVATKRALPLVPTAASILPRVVRPYNAWMRVPATLPAELLLHRVDLLHAQGWAPPWTPCPVVATIHDCAWDVFPQTYTRTMRWRLSLLVRSTAHRAKRIITSSRSSADDLVRFYGVPREKLRIIHPALDPDLRPVTDPDAIARVRARYRITSPYILYLGVVEPKKNLDRLIRAFRTLRREHGLQHQLVIAGRAGWLAQPILNLAAASGANGGVLVLGEVPAEHAGALYTGADVFAYLSSYEGFGFPPLEAMACGTPVLAADAASLPEALAGAALLVDPLDEEQVVQGLARLLRDQDLRARLRRRGFARTRQLDPASRAREVVTVYEECLRVLRKKEGRRA